MNPGWERILPAIVSIAIIITVAILRGCGNGYARRYPFGHVDCHHWNR
jgi:hypothetical protein